MIERALIFSLQLVLALGLVISVGCSEKEQTREHEHDLAVHMIEEGRYGEAIEVLNAGLTRDPRNQKTRVLLASAYSARGGILMRNYTDVTTEIINSAKLTKSLFEERGIVVFERVKAEARNESEFHLMETLEKVYKAIWQVSDLIRAFDKLPLVASSLELVDVEKAIEILDGDPHLTGGPLVYRGMLRLAVFRYRLENVYQLPELNQCRLETATFTSQLRALHREIRMLLADFSRGAMGRDRKKEVDQAIDDIDRAIHEALKWLSTLHGPQNIQDIRGMIDVSPTAQALHPALGEALNGECP